MALSTFNYPSDLQITDDFPQLPYEKYIKDQKPEQTGKFGQLKLFITELFFLCNYWDPISIPKLTVLYIGAGPGHHLITLIKMFPTIEWELYDLQQFAPGLEKLPNVKLFEKYFEDSDIERYANRDDVFMICDIRNLTYKQGDVRFDWRNEKKVLDDMRLQESWVLSIKPVYSSVKMRLPYANKEVIENIGENWEYLNGNLYVQPWIGPTSSESRLIVSRDNLEKRSWNLLKFEQQMFYHNRVRRMTRFKSDYTVDYDSRTSGMVIDSKSKRYAKDFVLSDYYDSVATLEILAHYARRRYGDKKIDLRPSVMGIIVPLTILKDSEE